MRTSIGLFIAVALVVLLLVIPAGLSAKERRGAELVVTRLDGSQAAGELIAVRPDSLLLLSAGTDLTIDLADIKSIRIVRKSRAEKGAFYGFLGGALTGALLASGGVDDFPGGEAALIFGAFFGAIGGLGGLGLGAILGVDTTIAVAGEPEALIQSHLEKLRAFSREFRLPGAKTRLEIRPAPEPRLPAPAPAATETAPPRHRRAPRFKLGLPFTGALSSGMGRDDQVQSSFRFPGDIPPGEAGPYPWSMGRSSWTESGSGFGSVSLAYEWSERWSAEVEVLLSGRRARGFESGALTFTSADDGKTYEVDFIFFSYQTHFSAALLGLTYRPFAPSEFRRHIVEAGLAIGPAWAKITADDFWQSASYARKLTFSARAHAAYDFYFIPALSIGTVVGYRYLRANFPESTTTDTLLFWDTADPYPVNSIERLTEVTYPSRKADASGFYIGLRLGLRI
ncbi:MAG: hypothetical protein IMZ54_12660 [Acidobacteria bacterium]|nr:hypothetical protein [Acidobacteriota bacterium]